MQRESAFSYAAWEGTLLENLLTPLADFFCSEQEHFLVCKNKSNKIHFLSVTTVNKNREKTSHCNNTSHPYATQWILSTPDIQLVVSLKCVNAESVCANFSQHHCLFRSSNSEDVCFLIRSKNIQEQNLKATLIKQQINWQGNLKYCYRPCNKICISWHVHVLRSTPA